MNLPPPVSVAEALLDTLNAWPDLTRDELRAYTAAILNASTIATPDSLVSRIVAAYQAAQTHSLERKA